MKILNLGGAGFIGSHLTRRLLDDGHSVTVVDRVDDKIRDWHGRPGLSFIRSDIADLHAELDDLVIGADLVVDLIAHANPAIYVRRPLDVFRLNFEENLRVAETCVKHGRRLVQFSSCEVYGKTAVSALGGRLPGPGNPAYATFTEDGSDFILGPVGRHRWIYACAKQLLERLLHAYGLEDRLDYTIVRPFNFIGPKIDYLPEPGGDGTPRVFSHFMAALRDGTPMRLVDGGRHRRCYTYIDDAIECVVRIVANPGGACRREIFNVGHPGNEISIRGLAERMRDLYARHFRRDGIPLPDLVDVPAREFYGEGYEDSDRRIPDISKARAKLGWEPRWGLDDMLLETMASHVRDFSAAG